MEIPSSQPLNLCYCYAFEDRKQAKMLKDHLTSLQMSGRLQECYDCAFSESGPWQQKIANHINRAHLVLLLISARFVASEKWYHREITLALERHNRGEAWVIPLFLKDVVVEETYLSELQMLPNNDQFIASARDKDHAYATIAREILKIAHEMGDTLLTNQVERLQNDLPILAVSSTDIAPVLDRQSDFCCICWSSQVSWLAVGRTDGTIECYHVQDHSQTFLLRGHKRDVYGLAWVNSYLASSSADGTVRIWDIQSQSTLRILQGHTGTVNSVSWSPDGKCLVTGSADKTLRLWNAGDGNMVRSPMTGHEQSVMSVSWSPDGKLLASGSRDRSIRLWNARGGHELRKIPSQAQIMSIAWSPDSQFLATVAETYVQVWQVSARTIVQTLQGHTSTVTSVAWSPDGKILAAGSRDQTITLWQPLSGKKVRTLQGHLQGVIGLTWSPDSKSLASVSHDELFFWEAETGKWRVGLDRQRVLKTILRQPEPSTRAGTMPDHDESDFEEFPQDQRAVQPQATPQEKGALICPDCYKLFPEKLVHNSRRRGKKMLVCEDCETEVSLLASQKQLDNNTMPEGVLADKSESPWRRIQATLQHKEETQTFDVFFCYNKQDRDAVERIGKQLKRKGILPWLEDWDLRPGQIRQKVLEEQILKATTAVVFLGPHGMEPWQGSEMYAILNQMTVRDEHSVIPVLLPGTPEHIGPPPFLGLRQPIDFRISDSNPLQKLLWGINRKK